MTVSARSAAAANDERDLLIHALYPHAVPVYLVARLLGRDAFAREREILRAMVAARSREDALSLANELRYSAANSDSFWCKWLRIRVSGRRALRLRRNLMAAA